MMMAQIDALKMTIGSDLYLDSFLEEIRLEQFKSELDTILASDGSLVDILECVESLIALQESHAAKKATRARLVHFLKGPVVWTESVQSCQHWVESRSMQLDACPHSRLFECVSRLGVLDLYFPIALDWMQSQLQRLILSHLETGGLNAVLPLCEHDLNESILPLIRSFPTTSQTEWESQLKSSLYRSVFKARLDSIFDLVVDYPDCLPALQDLKDYIAQYAGQNEIEMAIKSGNASRLLHVGANTSDIIDQYVSTYKTLEYLEMFESAHVSVLRPIKDYLGLKKEAVRCVLLKLLDRSCPGFSHGLPQSTILLELFDDKSVFANEYQLLLSERLLAMKDYNVENQVMELEILKSHLGDDILTRAQVMIRDVVDSRRLFSDFKPCSDIPLIRPLILSSLFWPPRVESQVGFPTSLQTILDLYQARFKEIKASRHLIWSHEGSMELELEFNGTVQVFQVSIPQAIAIMPFQTKDSIQHSDLLIETGLSSSLDGCLHYWESQGMLSCVGTTWSTSHSMDSSTTITESFYSDVAKPNPEIEQLKSTAWPFIVGMLTNLGPMNLSRIVSTLAMFAPGQFTSSENLFKFLTSMVLEDKLTCTQDTYTLKE